MGTHPRWVQTPSIVSYDSQTESCMPDVPNMINHSGFWTRSLSGWGSRRDSHLVSSASLISDSVRCRMKTGLPRHLIMTCSRQLQCPSIPHRTAELTFLPSGMAARSISTLAWAKTSAEADMLTRKSVAQRVSRCAFHRAAALQEGGGVARVPARGRSNG